MTVMFRPSPPESVLSAREEVTMHTIAPGWYPDAQGLLRWWDGTQWTANVASNQGVVTQQAPVVVVHQDRGKPVNHVLHAVLTVVTVGLWLPVWLIVAIAKN